MKYLFKLLLIIFISSTVQLNANSDKRFKEGYIISLNGDTTKGLLLTQESKNASETCIFKLNANSESKTYKPGEITSYRYSDGKYYISKEIAVDSTTSKFVFMEYLIKGMANVYYYVDHKEHYYIEKMPNGLTELTEEQTTFQANGRNYIAPAKYKGKLMAQLSDCPEIARDIQNASLTHKSLIKLTKNYHEKVCNTESCTIYEKGNTSANVKFGVLMGFSKNQYNFGNQLISNYGNNYQIGLALKLSNILMSNKHFNIKVKLLFEKDSKSYTLTKSDDLFQYFVTLDDERYFIGYDPYENVTRNSIKADLSVLDLKIPITLNYDFNLSKKTIFSFGIGLSNKVILSQNMDLKIDDFYKRYEKNINTLLSGVTANIGIEGKWFEKHAIFMNIAYEHLLDLRSGSDKILRLRNEQLSLFVGIYL